MNDDFEQRLRTMFATRDEPAVGDEIRGAVRQRIARLRRNRQIAWLVAVASGLAVAILVAPLLATSMLLVAEAPGTLNASLGALLVSPAGYVLGALSAVATLAAAFGD